MVRATGGGLALAVAGGALLGARGGRPSRAARLAGLGAALLAGSVLADSAMEHSRANFRERRMYAAPLVAGATVAAGVATALSRASAGPRRLVFRGAALTGLAGTVFHFRNILSRPGGLSFNNLFYRAPFGAPGALVLAGGLGLGALAAEEREPRAAGRALGLLGAGGLFGLTAEVGLLHFRGAFQNPAMYAPVTAVPATGLALAAATLRPSPARLRLARGALALTSVLGLVGTGFHAYGVSRGNGGWRNWTQNLFQGPPVAAPPSLAGIALGGFAALRLLAPGRRG
ncbi:hypothetical protein FJM51_14300 [Amaricoccus solimangrovi]|uniref:Uncharacterized protein n=1 Tax=Amaricoccus solimangrovi TaxID=2589815 RepID=A0A501WRH1_9RHOB|nr:hypothetical protein FJM51_14300 [Amaricoccus solimangrovi]